MQKNQNQLHRQERLAIIGQLATGIAHDFNNILTVIIGLTELARQHPHLPQEIEQNLEMISQQGSRAARLTRQILDFSQRPINQKQTLNLLPVIYETVELLKRTLPENILLTVDVEPGQYTLEADPVQLQQAIINLAINARDAMPSGGKLEFRLFHIACRSKGLSTCARVSPGQWLGLAISDSGVGMSPEICSRLFEPFFTTKKRGQGTGLGLARVYSTVKNLGGEIDVTSHTDQGTTFILFLPDSLGTTETSSQN